MVGAKKLPFYKAASLAKKMAKKGSAAKVTNEELHEDGRKIFGNIRGPQAKLNFILAVVMDLLNSVFQNRLSPNSGQYTRDPGKTSKGSSSKAVAQQDEPSGVCLGLGYAPGVISGSVSHQIQEIITQLNLMWCIAVANGNVNSYSPAGAAQVMAALPMLPDPNSFNYGGARDLMWRLPRADSRPQVVVLGDGDDGEDEDEDDGEDEWSATQAVLQEEWNKLTDAAEKKKKAYEDWQAGSGKAATKLLEAEGKLFSNMSEVVKGSMTVVLLRATNQDSSYQKLVAAFEKDVEAGEAKKREWDDAVKAADDKMKEISPVNEDDDEEDGARGGNGTASSSSSSSSSSSLAPPSKKGGERKRSRKSK